MSMAPAMKKVKKAAKKTLRWVMILGGIVAVSGLSICTAA